MLTRLYLHARRLWLLWCIDSTEAYMAACERDGILEGATLRHWRDCMAADRVQVALIEAQLRGEPATAASRG